MGYTQKLSGLKVHFGLRLALMLAVLGGSIGLLISAGPSQAEDPAWTGAYFNNKTLTGAPALTRQDAQIDFDWGNGSPATGINANNFSVRWTRQLDFQAGLFRFQTITDDGVRLYVDGVLVIDKWIDQGPTPWIADVNLTAGPHTIVMEYYENSIGAVARLSWSQLQVGGGWSGDYFNNKTLTGAPTLTKQDPEINFDWGTGSPAPGINANNFSVRWTRNLDFTAGLYRFTATADDGVRLFMDDVLVLDKWFDHGPTAYFVDLTLSAGSHKLVMEYYENGGGAVAKLNWTLLRSTESVWSSEYYSNPTLIGSPVLTRTDNDLYFNWGSGSPAPAVPADNFSARWTKTVNLSAGTYTFQATTDDGVRIYLDSQLILDHWVDQAATTHSVSVPITTGSHTVVMEYYESLFTAYAQLDFGLAGTDFVPPRILSVTPPESTVQVPTDGNVLVSFTGDVNPSTINGSTLYLQQVGPGTTVPAALTYDAASNTAILNPNALLQPQAIYNATAVGGPNGIKDAAGNAIPQTLTRQFVTGAAGLRRINTGGPQVTDSFSRTWTADSYFVGPGSAASANVIEIANTFDDAVYWDHRFDNAPFSYQIPVPNGDYKLRLLFANVFLTYDAGHKFDVAVEGQMKLDEFNEYLVAGFRTALTRQATATVLDGTLNVDISPSFGNATIAGIEIEPAAATRDLMEPGFTTPPEPEGKSYSTPPSVSLNASDNSGLETVLWSVNVNSYQPSVPETLLAGGLTGQSYSSQFVMSADVFNALTVGPHELHFGYIDDQGNAQVQVWKFRKVLADAGTGAIQFQRKTIATSSTPGMSAFAMPTVVELGPDGRLYVGQQNGIIYILTLDAADNVTAVETVMTISDTPNHNQDGSPAPEVIGRTLLGLTFDTASTAQAPILYATHSDPRFCFFQPICPIDNHSGMVTRLQGSEFDSPANRTDLITGLPRSLEQHATNAVRFGPDGWLYIAQAGNTNAGAPSTAFSHVAETYLSASILRANVNGASGSFPMDVRNVDSAAALTPGAFEIYATGLRNPYDFVFHSNGSMYVNDNGQNSGAGNTPGTAEGCPNGQSQDFGFRADHLHLMTPGAYGGHPNPARGECILDDGTMYTPPKTPQSNYTAPLLHYEAGASTNGIAEYKADTFGGQLQGNLISATYAGNQSVRRVVLGPGGTSVVFEENIAQFDNPLDIAVGPDGAIFVAEHGGNAITVLTPAITGEWSIRAPVPATSPGVHASGAAGAIGNAYVFGCIVAAQSVLQTLMYNPQTDSWQNVSHWPGPGLGDTTAVTVDDKIYLIGGAVNDGQNEGAGTSVDTLYLYDPATDTWTVKAPMPTPRSAVMAAAVGNKIYVMGGITGGQTNNLFSVYDIPTNSWTNLPALPLVVDHGTAQAIDGKVYLIGGKPSTILNDALDSNWMYDPVAGTWTAKAVLPTARFSLGSSVLDGKIFVFGGEGPLGVPSNGNNEEMEAYSPATDTWETHSPMIQPVHGIQGVTIGNSIYVPGGGEAFGESTGHTNQVFVLSGGGVAGDNDGDGIPDAFDSDDDNDCYSDDDELANGTEPLSPASSPPDNDGDCTSDLNDTDDDNDGVPDNQDQFVVDPANGAATQLPVLFEWNPGGVQHGKLANSGFTGVQLSSNGGQFLAGLVRPGGAGGAMVLTSTPGDNAAAQDNQDNGLQIGFDARNPFVITSRLIDPFIGVTPAPGEYGGIFFALDEDNYIELVAIGQPGNGMAIALQAEFGQTLQSQLSPPLTLPIQKLDLRLAGDPAAGSVAAQYRVDSDSDAAWVPFGVTSTVQQPSLASFFEAQRAAGVITTDAGTGPAAAFSYDFFHIEAPSSAPINDAPVCAGANVSTIPNTASAPFSLNCTDADTDPLTCSVASQGAKGTLAIANCGSAVYTPNAGASGSDSITYAANDGSANSAPATVSVTINQPPTCAGASVTMNQGTASAPFSLNCTDPESSPLACSVTEQGTKGTLAITSCASAVYTPNAGASGSDSVTYLANDGSANSTPTTVSVTIAAVPTGPSVQSGTATFASGSTTLNVPITAVDPSKAMLLFSLQVSSASPAVSQVSGKLTGPGTITFQRWSSTGTAAISWSVVEYPQGVLVQRGSIAMNAPTKNVTLPAPTDLSRSLPIVTFRTSGNDFDSSDLIRAKLTSTTNLELQVTAAPTATNVVEWQVVQFTNATVTSGDVSFSAADATKAVEAPSSDPAKSWLAYSYKSATGTLANVGQKLVRGTIISPTVLSFDRATTGQALDITWYRVQFTDSTVVQQGTATFTASETQKVVTIASVNQMNSVVVAGYFQRGGQAGYTANDDPGPGWFSLSLASPTQLDIKRTISGSVPAAVSWSVITFGS